MRKEMERLRAEEHMDFLENLTGLDWEEEGLGVIYQLESTETGKRVSLKSVCADRENPMLPSVSDLWDIANIYEREVYDFYGIIFTGHPDMRRIFMAERVAVLHGAEIVETVSEGQGLRISQAFADFLHAAVDISEHGVDLADALTVEAHAEMKHTVG